MTPRCSQESPHRAVAKALWRVGHKGTRLTVEFILALMAKGWTEQQLLENYERLKPTHLKPIFAFASR